MKGSSLRRSSSSRRNRWSAPESSRSRRRQACKARPRARREVGWLARFRIAPNGVARSLATQGRKYADRFLQVLGVGPFKSIPATGSVGFPRETSARAPQSAWATRRVSEPAENSCVGQFSACKACRQSVPSPAGLGPSFSTGFSGCKANRTSPSIGFQGNGRARRAVSFRWGLSLSHSVDTRWLSVRSTSVCG